MITEHFYIRDDASKLVYTKINYNDVIMVYSDGNCCYFYLTNTASGKIKIYSTIADCYIKYFKGVDQFIRSSAEFIININNIVGANKIKNGHLEIILSEGNKATLRITHLYAQKILKCDRKSSTLASIPRMVNDSIKKDEIILEYPNAMLARRKIKEDLGEKVSIAYIRNRMKTLSSYE